MSLGIFSQAERRSPLRGLGATSIIPGECWNQPNFKSCHGLAYSAAVRHCDALGFRAGAQRDACIVSKADADALRSCGCRLTGGSSASTAPTLLPWRGSTPDSRVSSLQRAVNSQITPKGYPALGVDGKLGAGTCGAARLSDREFGTAFMSQYRLADVCQSYTEPRKAGGLGPSLPTTLEPAPQTSTASLLGGFDLKMLLMVGAVGVGAMLLFSGDKEKKE